MSLHKRIQQDMIAALKARNARARSALSFVASELKRVAIDTRVDQLQDPEAIAVLRKQLKLRQEAAEQARAANRGDLVDQNEYEIKLISEYLPKSPDAARMTALAEKVIADLGATSMRDMGRVITECATREPAVDKGALSAIVKSRLGGK